MPSAAVMHRSDRRHSYQFGAVGQHQSPGNDDGGQVKWKAPATGKIGFEVEATGKTVRPQHLAPEAFI